MMRLPLMYNLRSIAARRARTALTIAGIAVVIFIAVLMSALSRGLISSAQTTGSPRNVMVFSRGAEMVEFSAVSPADELRLRNAPNVELASPEISVNTLVSLPGHQGDDLRDRRLIVRGVSDLAPLVHEQVALIEGRWPSRGNEVVVGALAHAKLRLPKEQLAIGRTIAFEGDDWTIVGMFAASGTAFEAEAWTHVDDLRTATRRDDYSIVVLRAADANAARDIVFDLSMRTDVLVEPRLETAYYAAHAQRLSRIQSITMATSLILVIGGVLAGMNTMFNSILGRVQEMGVLMVLGYRRGSILASFMLESLLLSMIAGMIGVGAGLFLNDLPMAVPMAAFRFAVDPITIGFGLTLAFGIGVFSVMLPMWRVSRLSAAEALRNSYS